MLKEKMNSSKIIELLEIDSNLFLNELNDILENKEKETEIKNITNEIQNEDGCLYSYLDINYKRFSEILKSYNIYWVALLKRFCFCSTQQLKAIPDDSSKKDICIKGKEYQNIKQYAIRFDSSLKEELEKLYKDYPCFDRTYINSRVLEIGLNELK